MAITLVQSPNGVTGSTSVSVTWGSNTTAGNLLVAVVLARGGKGVVPTISAPSSSWIQATTVSPGSGSIRASIYYLESAAAQSSTGNFTCSGSIGREMVLIVAEYSGLNYAGAKDGTATNSSAGSSTPDSGSATMGEAAELLVAGFCQHNSNSTFSAPTNSFTIEKQKQGTSFITGGLTDRITTAVVSANCSVTSTQSGAWAGCVATFKAKANAAKIMAHI